MPVSNKPFTLILGPCVVESLDLLDEVAAELEKMRKPGLEIIFKSSYRKANRSKLDSYMGLGDLKALEYLHQVGKKYNFPTVTDIHDADEAAMAASYVDVIQIPAFLARQTDILVAAGQTGKIVNIKKGQFMSADAMKFAIEKVESTGNDKVWLTERGTFFGYEDLVVDFRNVPLMAKLGKPVIVDCTHSLQKPNQSSGVTGGNPELIETIARAAVAVGADGLFIETHPNPAVALSDGANMLKLSSLSGLITRILKIREAVESLKQ